MVQVFMEVQGLEFLHNALLTLETKIGKKGVRKGNRAAGNIFLKQEKANAKNMVGGNMGVAIANVLALRVWKKQRRGMHGMIVRPKRSLNKFIYYTKDDRRKRYYIPFAIEYGHAFPGRGGSKGAPKDVKPIPFMRKAFMTRKKQAFNAQVSTIVNWIQLQWKTGGKRFG